MKICKCTQGRLLLTVFVVLCLSLCAAGAFAQEHWSQPQPITEIIGDFNTAAPFISSDGKSLYFRSDQNHMNVQTRFYAATRPQAHGPFTSVMELAVLNDANSYSIPQPDGRILFKAPATPIGYVWVSADNLRMYYTTTLMLSGGVVCTERQNETVPWRRGSRIVLGSSSQWPVKNIGMYGRISLTQDELVITVASGSGTKTSLPAMELQYGTRNNISENFDSAMAIDGLDSLASESDPFIMPDGLAIYFVSNRGNEGYRIFKAVRAGREEAFGNVQLVDDLVLPECNLRCPALSTDGTAIYFEVQKTINGQMTKSDIYYSEVIKEPTVLARHLIEHAMIEKDKVSDSLAQAQEFEREAMRNLEIALKDAKGIARKNLFKAKIHLAISIVRQKIADREILESLDELEKAMDF